MDDDRPERIASFRSSGCHILPGGHNKRHRRLGELQMMLKADIRELRHSTLCDLLDSLISAIGKFDSLVYCGSDWGARVFLRSSRPLFLLGDMFGAHHFDAN